MNIARFLNLEIPMRMPMLFLLVLALFTVLANAQPITYYVQGTFSDGGTFNGSFSYNADSNTYSAVNIVTTPGTVRTTGATYQFVCGQDVPTCNGVSPDATGYLNLTSAATNQTGLPAMSLFFGTPLSPPSLFASTDGALFSLEANCSNSTCSAPAGPTRSTGSGTTASSETLLQYMFFGS